GVELVVEGASGRPLPRLAGNPGTPHPAVHRALGSPGVVAIEAARRHGLQSVDFQDGTAHRSSFSGSPSPDGEEVSGRYAWKLRPPRWRTWRSPSGRWAW